MSLSYIRIARTPDVDKVISDLQNRYSLLSEAEIIKLALSEAHARKVDEALEKEQALREKFNHALEEGGRIGDQILAKGGYRKENMSEQEIYDTFFDTHNQRT